MAISSKILDQLKAIAGPKGWSQDSAEIAPHMQEWRGRHTGATPLLLKPDSTETLAALVKICHESGTALVPQGGNTGLVRGGVPTTVGDEILVSLKRMNGVLETNQANNSITALAGTPVQSLHDAARSAERSFGLSLASQGSCTAGGIASTNAGGIHVVRYGVTRDLVIGLEAVLPNGAIFSDLAGIKKDNTGYNLRGLLVGAEGTLGIITKVMFKLFPETVDKHLALIAVPSVEAAVGILNQAHAMGNGTLSAFELMPKIAMDVVASYRSDLKPPLAFDAPWYALIEFSGSRPNPSFKDAMENWLASLMEDGRVLNGVIAANTQQFEAFWLWRELISEAQEQIGSSLKHDVSVAVEKVPLLLERAAQQTQKMMPGVRPIMFGHLGDGNIHLNLSQPTTMTSQEFFSHHDALARLVYDLVAELGGSFSAEHGVGMLKVAELKRYKDPVALAAMSAVKKALDPKNIMNPGRILE